ncbi:MAG: hypothetical protein ACK6CT_09990 [Planctomycetia bacterium]
MRRASLALMVVGGILLVSLVVGGWHRAIAGGREGGLELDTDSFPGQVTVAATAAGAEGAEDGPTFAVADEDREDERDGDRGERRRSRHHQGPHEGRHRPHDMHGHRGPPGPPPGFHHAMRRFDDIIERLAKIESKLGIEDPAPARRERRARPEQRDGEPAGAEPGRQPGPRSPRSATETGRSREERVAEMRQRMEDARRRFREMEERVKKLEAEIERMKGGNGGN